MNQVTTIGGTKKQRKLAEDIVWYWDEPTITLDYEEHEFHDILERNWKQNRIPNIVLSSATLPDKDDISCMSRYFCDKFKGRVKEIKSYECNKSIPIYDKDGNIIMPHLYYDNARDLRKCVQHIKKNYNINNNNNHHMNHNI